MPVQTTASNCRKPRAIHSIKTVRKLVLMQQRLVQKYNGGLGVQVDGDEVLRSPSRRRNCGIMTADLHSRDPYASAPHATLTVITGRLTTDSPGPARPR